MPFELAEVRLHWALVFLHARSGEVVLYGAIGVAFDFQVNSTHVPLGRYSSLRCRDNCGGIYGVVIKGVEQQPQQLLPQPPAWAVFSRLGDFSPARAAG